MFKDLPQAQRNWWLIVEPRTGADLCSVDPGFDVDLYLSTDLRTMTEIWMGYTSITRAKKDEKLVITGNNQLARTVVSWLTLSPFAKIEKLVLERWKILEENKKLKGMLKRRGTKNVKEETPSSEHSERDTVNIEHDENLEKAFKYVVVTIHMECKGDQYETLDKIDRLLSRFQVIDPEEEGLTEKSLFVIRDYFELRNKEYSQSGSQDLTAMINFFKDEVEEILNQSEFSDPNKRVTLIKELREVYDGYIPKSTR